MTKAMDRSGKCCKRDSDKAACCGSHASRNRDGRKLPDCMSGGRNRGADRTVCQGGSTDGCGQRQGAL